MRGARLLAWALLVPWIVECGLPYESNRKAAAQQMRHLEIAIDLYRLRTGRLPSSEDGLDVLIQPLPPDEAPLMRELPLDPWGHRYFYTSNGTKYSIVSAGLDGLVGTADDVTSSEVARQRGCAGCTGCG